VTASSGRNSSGVQLSLQWALLLFISAPLWKTEKNRKVEVTAQDSTPIFRML
jgi:hypothetical protein